MTMFCSLSVNALFLGSNKRYGASSYAYLEGKFMDIFPDTKEEKIDKYHPQFPMVASSQHTIDVAEFKSTFIVL